MKISIVVFPGSNCDRDMQVAVRSVTGFEPKMIWHSDSDFEKTDLIILPGGFSYGDYLRCGAMASKTMVMREVVRRARMGVPVLGVCNGFQILIESGLLPGALMRNSGIKYVCKDVFLSVHCPNSIFTQGLSSTDILRIPIAHRDGNYFATTAILDELEAKNRIVFKYVDKDGCETSASNPNGSQRNIAGVLNEDRNVLGMMPHPERLYDPILGGADGKLFFRGIVKALS